MTHRSERWSRLLLLAVLAALHPGCASAEVTASAAAATPTPPPAVAAPAELPDGSRDFDFEHGEWTIELSRLVAPLTGSTTWTEYTGTSVVRPLWGGDANLGELEVTGQGGSIRGLSLRLYDPGSRQWRIHWANSRDGELGPPMIGGFRDGIGRFHNQETFAGRAIFVRFLFTDLTPTTFRLEQAFSADGGKTWEPNWIARFEKVR